MDKNSSETAVESGTDQSEADQAEMEPGRTDKMSAYEAQRAANMFENQEFLRKMGLDRLTMKKPNMFKKREKASDSLPPAPVRSSKRLQEVPRPNYIDDSYLVDHLEN